MAEIPRYVRNVAIPKALGVRTPESLAPTGIGQALQMAGKSLSVLGDAQTKRAQTQDIIDAENVLNNTRLGASGELLALGNEKISSAQYQERANEIITRRAGEAESALGKLRTAEAYNHGVKLLGSWQVDALMRQAGESDRRFTSEARASVVSTLPTLEENAITAKTEAQMSAAMAEIRTYLSSISDNVYKSDEIAKMMRDSEDRIVETRYRSVIAANPVHGVMFLSDPEASKRIDTKMAERLTAFADAKMRADEAAERRKDADIHRTEKKMNDELDKFYTDKILAGEDITRELQEDRQLTAETKRTLRNFQHTLATQGGGDTAEMTRWRVAANTGIDPATNQRITWADIAKAFGVDGKTKGVLIDKFFTEKQQRESKGEALRDRRYSLGKHNIDMLLTPNEGGIFAAMLRGMESGAGLDTLNHYQALLEYDATSREQLDRDPVDIADEIAMRRARTIISKFAGDTSRLFHGYGVTSFEDLMAKVKSGQISRQQADAVLRLGEFLKFRDKAIVKPTPEAPTTTEQERGRSAFDAFMEFMRGAWGGPGTGERTPTKRK